MVGVVFIFFIVGILFIIVMMFGWCDYGVVLFFWLIWLLLVVVVGIVCINVDLFGYELVMIVINVWLVW